MKKLLLLLFAFVPMMVMAQNEGGAPRQSVHSVMDDHDRCAVQIIYTYNDSGIVDTRTLQSFDKQQRPVRKEIYTADEYLLYTETITYDCKGRKSKVEQVSYDENGQPDKNTFKYKYAKDGSMTIFLNGKQL